MHCRSKSRPGKDGKAGRKASKTSGAKVSSDDERGSGDDSDMEDEDFLVCCSSLGHRSQIWKHKGSGVTAACLAHHMQWLAAGRVQRQGRPSRGNNQTSS